MLRPTANRARAVGVVALGVLGGLAFGAPASAQEADDGQQSAQEDMQGGGFTEERQVDDMAAREHFRIATRYYDQGRFVEAAQQFEEAYELSGRSELLYNAYIAHREANQLPDAAAMLERYLNDVPDAPDRQNLEARLSELQRAIAEDSQMQTELAEARERADREAAARREAESQVEAWPWVILGVGGAALIAGAVTGPLALAGASDLRSNCDDEGLCDPSVDIDGQRDDAQTLALVTDILLIGGGTVAAVGLILGLTLGLGGGGDDEEEAAVEAGATCGLGGCVATVRGRF